MNFSIKKNELHNALSIASHAISTNSPQPALRGIMITANDDSLSIKATDGDVSIFVDIPKTEENQLNIVEKGELLLEAKYLLEIVKKIDSDEINIETLDGTLTKFSGTSAQFKMNGMRTQDYPNIVSFEPDVKFDLKNSDLIQIIDQTVFATSSKDTRPILTGVNFALNNNELVCTATDSYRLAKKKIPFENSNSFNVTIPAKTLNEVKSTMLQVGDDEVEIGLSDKRALFVNSKMQIQTRLLEGMYPETDRLIPNEFPYELKVNRHDLMSAIDRSQFIKNDNMTINRLQCSSGEVVLTNKNQEVGEFHEELAASFTGNPLDISFAANYVLDAAKALNGQDLSIKFTGEMKPFILTSTEDDEILQLVLPVRTYN